MRTEAMHAPAAGVMGPKGLRIFDSVAAGRFEGARLRGEIVPGSGDWRLIRSDGGMEVDARAILRTDDGSVIHMTYSGRIAIPPPLLAQVRDPQRRHLVDPASYYFRIAPTFETGSETYAWLNDVVALGYGRLLQGQAFVYEVFEIL
jgi:hypothetical protein